jgi:hypothetical protein
MTTDGHLDRVLDRWLSEGPSIVPDRVIDAALAEVPTTRQRGAGWLLRRYPRMTTIARGVQAPQARLLIGIAAVVAVALVGLRLAGGLNVGGPDNSALGDGTTFTSDRYGYSVTVPADFEHFEIPGTWATGETPILNGPGSDVYSGPGTVNDRIDMIVWSQAVAAGTTLDAYVAEYDALMARTAGSCAAIVTSGSLSVGGERARFTTHQCPDDAGTIGAHEAVVLHADRAYVIAMAAPTHVLSDAELGTLFESVLATFSFTD